MRWSMKHSAVQGKGNSKWCLTRVSTKGRLQPKRPSATYCSQNYRNSSNKFRRYLFHLTPLLKENISICALDSKVNVEEPQRNFPASIHDVSNKNILGFGANLAEDHP
jgi:hypothetical protein